MRKRLGKPPGQDLFWRALEGFEAIGTYSEVSGLVPVDIGDPIQDEVSKKLCRMSGFSCILYVWVS